MKTLIASRTVDHVFRKVGVYSVIAIIIDYHLLLLFGCVLKKVPVDAVYIYHAYVAIFSTLYADSDDITDKGGVHNNRIFIKKIR
jgi:hypothetical protein